MFTNIIGIRKNMIYLIGGAEGHHEEPDQGVRHGKRGDQIIGGRVETPLLEQIIIKSSLLVAQTGKKFF